MAFDLNDLKNAGRMDPSDLQGLHTADNTEEPSRLQADMTPFVGDFPIVDTTYIIGPGDSFQIFYESTGMERQVNPEGNIVLNRIGVIALEGLTLKEAKRLLVGKLQTSHKKSECFVNISRPKTMRVFMTGAVISPGSYQIPGNFRLSDVLALAHGYSGMAQRGNIQITAKDGSVQPVNLGKFLVDGDLGSNPYLPQGANIHVPFIDFSKPWVVIRKDTLAQPVQLEPNENVRDLILKFHSFNSPPPYSAIVIKEKDGKEVLIGQSEMNDYHPKAEAQLEIIAQKKDVYVAGAVMRPGYQTYKSNFRLIQYVSDAGLLTSSKILDKMMVTRLDGKKEMVSTNDGLLSPGDMIYVDQNAEQRFIIYTPILLSLASLTIALVTILRY